MTLLEVKALKKTYTTRLGGHLVPALTNVSFSVEEGEYLVQDLLGCRVVDADTGADYGQVYDVRPTGANDVYYLRDAQGRERLVPAIPQVVLELDIDGGVITIRPLEGLFDD